MTRLSIIFLITILILILVANNSISHSFSGSYISEDPFSVFDFPFEDNYRNQAIYVHELINYQYHPRWNSDWEQNFLKANGLRMTTGSIATDELLLMGQLTLNVDLSRGWWFNVRGDYYEGRHRNNFQKTFLLGLEREISKKVSVFLLFQPQLLKEIADMQAGISLFDKRRENYLNVALVLEDFAYNEKNDFAGESVQSPRGIKWYGRYSRGKFCLYTEGRYGSGFERIFPDAEKSPFQKFHSRQINDGHVKLYYETTRSALIVLQLYHYLFNEACSFYDAQFDYDYQNAIYDASVQYLFSWRERHHFRLLCHFLRQDARSLGFQQHDYEREDFMPAFFYEYHISDHIVELGYFIALNNWNYESQWERNSYTRSDAYYDKVYLGYTFAFNQNAKIHLSISHQPSISGFGGANVKYMMLF